MNDISYNARIYKTEIYKGAKATTYYVRWRVVGAPKPFREPFRHSAQAESYRSKLLTAAREGEAFNTTTGRPVAWQRDESKEPADRPVTWYALTLDYAAAKWKYVSPNQRRSIAEALTDATEVLFTTEAPYTRGELRRRLRHGRTVPGCAGKPTHRRISAQSSSG